MVTPKEQNILATLNLLVLLLRARKQTIPPLTEEQKHTLKVTKEHLTTAGISIPVFANTLQILAEKGYLLGVTIFEDKFHSEIQKALSDENLQQKIAGLGKIDTSEFMRQFKEHFADSLEKIIPANMVLDRDALMEDKDITLPSIIGDALGALAGHTSDDVAIVPLMPFRSIERVLEKMNDGVKFDEVQDVGIWYDSKNYVFHIDEDTVSTAYQHKPNKEHYVLSVLFGKGGESIIDYTDVPEFDNSHDGEMRSYRDALDRFIRKHPELPKIFIVHADHLEILPEYLKQTR